MIGSMIGIVFVSIIGLLGFMAKSWHDRRYKKEEALDAEDRLIHNNLLSLTVSCVRTEEKIDYIISTLADLPCRNKGNNIPPGAKPAPCPAASDT